MPTEKEWTVMFYFASDNPLAPGIVSQLKSIKNAGYHQNVNVVAQFDPQTADTPTHIFDVNLVNKLTKPKRQHEIGFRGNDPYIRNLVLDKLWGDEKDSTQIPIKKRLAEVLGTNDKVEYEAPEPPPYLRPKARQARDGGPSIPQVKATELSPLESLGSFLAFCANSYPAKHYMLFIVGHGLVVGNDMFLYDANAAEQSLSLKNLAKLLAMFKTEIGGNKLKLLGLHSCSMSSLELAYELEGLANNLLASQGPAFVGSWPYREILIRVFNDQKNREEGVRGADTAIDSTIEKIFKYILYNSYDFQLAGYSFDLSWCGLNRSLVPLTQALDNLSGVLINGLQKTNTLARQAITLAHWEAQSFFQETYTDLYDFCFCLKRRAEELVKLATPEAPILSKMASNCQAVMTALRVDAPINRFNGSGNGNHANDPKPLIIRSDFAGPEYQYSRGVSVYFPWSEPINQNFWQTEYPSYKFQATGWGKFLDAYVKETVRDPIFAETTGRAASFEQQLLEEITCRLFNENGQLSRHAGSICKDNCSLGVDQFDKTGSDSGMSTTLDKSAADSGMSGSISPSGVSTLVTGSGSSLGSFFGGSLVLGEEEDKTGSGSGMGAGDKSGSGSRNWQRMRLSVDKELPIIYAAKEPSGSV